LDVALLLVRKRRILFTSLLTPLRRKESVMELRFLERDGKKILQQKQYPDDDEDGVVAWNDIPCVKEEVIWCDHIKQKMSIKAGHQRWFFNRVGHDYYIADEWTLCPICGAKKP
jgi:hypothetical protein